MPPPSPLSIATGSVLRLVKEETSYQKEMQQQQSRISKLEQGDGADENADFILKQEKQALEETKAVFPPLRERIAAAVEKLEQFLDGGAETNTEEITKAKEAVAKAKAAPREIS